MNPNMTFEVPFLKSAFNEAVLNANRLNELLAPFYYIPTLAAQYAAANGNGFISENENGVDPRQPQAVRAPAIELVRGFQEKLVSTDIYRRKVYLGRIERSQANLMFDSDVYLSEEAVLVNHIADLVEWKTAEFYQASGNYAPGQQSVGMNFTTLTAGGLLALLRDWAAAINPTNNRSDSYALRLVVGASVWGEILSLLGPVVNKDTGVGTYDQIKDYIQQFIGGGIEIVTSNSRYNKNATASPAVTAPMWANDFAALSVVSDSPGVVQGFVNTVATDQGELGPNGKLINRFADVYASEIADPRGVELFIEALFAVGAGDPERGVKFNVTI